MFKMDLWNRRFLEAPPVSTYKNHEKLDVKNFICIVNESAEFLNDQRYLEADAALLSRVIYRMKRPFRTHKGFKAMEKTNSALLRCLQLNFGDIIDALLSLASDDAYLPTRNFLHYVLIRLQGFSKLMCRVVECCETVVFCIDKQFNLGHNWRNGLIVTALMSRIWVLSKNVVKKCCQFYSDLLPYSEVFRNVGKDWLPINYSFPQDLKSWLEIKWSWIDKNIPSSIGMSHVNKIDNHQHEKEVEQNQNVDKNKSAVAVPVTANELFKGFDVSEEIGEIIESPKTTNKKRKRRTNTTVVKHKKSKQHKKINKKLAFDKLNTLEDFKRFIHVEDRLRSKNSVQCSFKKIDKLQWNILRKTLIKEIKIAQKNEAKGNVVVKQIERIKELLKLNM